MRIGVLTGGGDCPGLNAVIRAVVRKGVKEYGHEFIGFRDGWKGPLEGLTMPLNIETTRGILPRGGTILGSSRTNPFKIENGVEKIKDNLAKAGIDALIAIGGEDTLGVATKLDSLGVKVIGVPKTIDNDLNNTDYTFGFDTAVNIAVEAIDRLHTTAESHHRALIVEVMGRGVTVYSGKRGFGKSGETKEVDIIYTVITRLELNKLNTEIEKIEPNAFVVMNSVKDTKGGMIKKRPLKH